MSERALTPAPTPNLENARARLADLEVRLAEREAELAAFKTELRGLQDAYLDKMSAWHAQLAELDAAVANAEIRAGLRPAAEPDEPMTPMPMKGARTRCTRRDRRRPTTCGACSATSPRPFIRTSPRMIRRDTGGTR